MGHPWASGPGNPEWDHDDPTIPQISGGDRGLKPMPGNVSVRVVVDGMKVDLVPGRKQHGNDGHHTLYSRRRDSWTQTNVEQHIQLVAGCGRRDEIRAMKVWRERQRFDFPSFYLELSVIEALKRKRAGGLAENVRETLRYLAERAGRSAAD
jgi:hypothetical protein